MTSVLGIGGRPLLLGGKFRLVPDPLPAGSDVLTDVAGLAAWWDVTGLAPGAVSSVADRSGNARALSVGTAGVIPRLAGPLPGLGQINGPNNYTVLAPYVEPTSTYTATVPVGSDGSLTVLEVYTRPNLVQDGSNPTNAAAPLIRINGTTVLDVTGRGDGTDTLRLFPAGAAITGGTLPLRHTQSIRVVLMATTVDVWLDGTRVITGAVNTLSLSGAAAVSLLPGAQCFLHCTAVWPRAISSDADHAVLTRYGRRWALGRRAAADYLGVGQSNIGYFHSNALAFVQLQRSLMFWTGRPSANELINSYSGKSVYGSGCFLEQAGGDPSTWVYGTDGQTFRSTVAGYSADVRGNITAILWFWSESDSLRAYSEKATVLAATRRAWQLIRAELGLTAAQLPVCLISALPFSPNAAGNNMMRETEAELLADASQNAWPCLPNSSDAIGRASGWDPATGVETGGDGGHRADPDYVNYAYRMGLGIARAVVAAAAARGLGDDTLALPGSVTGPGGPTIVSAHYEGTAYATTGSVLVTLAHQNGATDMRLPLRAALGAGWTVMDGGSVTAPGTLVNATVATRVSATTIRLTLASTLANASTARLYYPYGTALDTSSYAVIGRGNAVTDNASTVAPGGLEIGAGLGAAYQPDMPVQTPAYGVLLT